MTSRSRRTFALFACAVAAACGSPSREPLPITPPAEVAGAPVARVPVAPALSPGSPASLPTTASATTPGAQLDPASFPANAVYVCASGAADPRTITAIAFDEKVGSLCRRHPEMGPCQYERNICRKSGGRVYAADGSEITMAKEAEFDKKVLRVRFSSK